MNETEKKQFEKDFLDGKIILCDPGQNSPLYFMASNNIIHKKEKNFETNNFGISYWNNHKIMNYTNQTRIKFLKREKYANLVENWKRNTDNEKFNFEINQRENILKRYSKKMSKEAIKLLNDEIIQGNKSLKDIEAELSKYNAKSCTYKEFIKYIRKKLEFNKKAQKQYDTTYLQKLKWFTYLNKNKHENDLLNHIQNEFGKDITIIIGDWSGRGHTKFMSTPKIGLKRKLSERFKVYLIDEYLTSKLHYKHHVRCNNLKIKVELTEDKEKPLSENSTLVNMQPKYESKYLHSVLTYKIVKDMGCKKSEMGCINRDKNSVLNMESIVSELIKTGKRPSRFNRTTNQTIQEGAVNGLMPEGANSQGVINLSKTVNKLQKKTKVSLSKKTKVI
jgi:hypothetical protein